ncbi:MAG: TolC family protein [candidate division Zixibacteria bacterium]|nr:TolC family protein [candidate division Zixibacteria bacterium]
MKRIALWFFVTVLAASGMGAPRKAVRVGFFEGGDYYSHSILRTAYQDALEHLAPSSFQFIYMPNGFKSAEWKRDRCASLAGEYVRDTTIDVVVAMGPWVVQELLKAGFKRPIVGLYQFDPGAEGLLNREGRPVVRNLTVHVRPDKIRHDLATIVDLYGVKRIGVLAFNDSPDDTAVMNKCWQIGKSMGLEITWTQGYGASGTYAFFKAYGLLPKSVEAVYVSPLWGMTLAMIDQFSTNLAADHIPLFTSEGRFLLEKGILGSGSVNPEQSAAQFAAWKTIRIAQGEVPADLPIEFPEMRGFAVNLEPTKLMARDISSERLYQADLINEFTPSENTMALTLEDAVSRALAQNPSYQAAHTAIEAADLTLSRAKSGYLPDISIDAAATAASQSASDNTNGLVSRNRYRAGLAIDQPLFSLGALRAIKSAREERLLNQASVEQAKRDLELAVTAAYLDCLTARSRVTEYSQLRRRLDDLLQAARLGDFIDPQRPQDQTRWEAYRMEVWRRLIEQRDRLRQAFATLNTLLGQPSTTELALDTAGLTEENFVGEFSALRPIFASRRFGPQAQQFIQAEAIRNNPTMKSAGAAVRVAGAKLDFGKAQSYPGLSVRGWFGYADSLANTPVFTEKHDLWSVGAVFSWPLFSSRHKTVDRKVARLSVDRAEYERDAARLKIVTDVDNSWNNLRSLGVEIPLASSAADRSAEYFDSTKFAYLAGRRSISDAVDAVQSDFQARLDLLSLRYEYFASVATLIHHIGWPTADERDRGGAAQIFW